MELEALWGIGQKILQLCGGFGEMAGVVLCHRCLELLVQPLGLLAASRDGQGSGQYHRSGAHGAESKAHGLDAITCRTASECTDTKSYRRECASQKRILWQGYHCLASSTTLKQIESAADRTGRRAWIRSRQSWNWCNWWNPKLRQRRCLQIPDY